MNAERRRLLEQQAGRHPWRRWGPYLSERQWGTVREDYSPQGDAWDYLPFSEAHSRAYRWGEDGLAGLCDNMQRLCLSLALWNEADPILKERLFGLTNGQGNHGEDVKECYYYLDALPSHAYLKMLYKYPQVEFPYARLLDENRLAGKQDAEFELPDAGVFDDDRYFDVVVEYAKASPYDVLMSITVSNRGPEAAPLHVLPQLVLRNTWSWDRDAPKPRLWALDDQAIGCEHDRLKEYFLYCDRPAGLWFADNETNVRRLFNEPEAAGYFKDAFHELLVEGRTAAINPRREGTKAAAHFPLRIEAGGQAQVRLRLTNARQDDPFTDFDATVRQRVADADEFYAELQQGIENPDARAVQRQALAGMIWNKQFYYYDIPPWLDGDPGQPPPPKERLHGRNHNWRHLNNADIISMPDKWEYPWYAAWDLAFHCLPLALLDAEFAKEQLVLLLREWYMHPNGQLPAYEWNFGDVNPPVHAWAAWRVFQIDRKQRGDAGDTAFLERVFHKLLLNFTWWVNRKDAEGRNVFQGGFLGLDNIGIFDRSKPLPTGGHLDQADGTSWMAMYSLNMMRIALELALTNPVYQDVATKFFEHFLSIAEAMTNIGETGRALWDEEDGFFYDILRLPDGRDVPLKIHSLVGLIPLFAVETLEPELLDRLPEFRKRLEWYLKNRPQLAALVSHWTEPGSGERRLLSLLRGHRMKCLLARMLDETKFLSPYGVRSMSRRHGAEPYVFQCNGHKLSVDYEPGESETSLFGGNSNWRGPVWMPLNYLIVESLQKFHHYYGDDFKIECPVGSGQMTTLLGAAEELSRRLVSLFLRGADGRRPIHGDCEKQQLDPHFRDHLLFHEYFHGETGRGLGAAHQTGWTGLVAKLIHPRRPEDHCVDPTRLAAEASA